MTSPTIAFDPELIRRFDCNGPRYTSYPTADRFGEGFGAEAYRASAIRRNRLGLRRPLSLYVHLPFCRDICYYCACNKIVTRDAGKAAHYLDYLRKEIEMQSLLFRDDPRVVQMHWGGGTPTFHSTAELRRLFEWIAGRFELAPDGEYSIQVDPRTVDAQAIRELREIGFNRVSFGVQDFDPGVQAAVHRVQDERLTLSTIDAARRASFDSVNLDLIYGLPRQTATSFDRTLALVSAVRPDRIALYSYAHLPACFASQRRIRDVDLPSPDRKLELFGLAVSRLTAAGYLHIGLDHFALPLDELAVAQRRGRLYRNFQGYSTRADADLVGLGVSAIGAVGPTYSQNHRVIGEYCACLDRGELPVASGVALTCGDVVRRAVIQALMCQFALSKESFEIAHLIDFDRYFAAELRQLREFERLGLIQSGDGWLTVTPKGRFLVRSICMVFDRYLREGQDGRRYSRVI